MVDGKKIDKLGQLIKESKYMVVLTGAGISTESGVPDFRSRWMVESIFGWQLLML